MRDIRRASANIIVTAWLKAFGVACVAAPHATKPVGNEFQAFLAKVDTAAVRSG